jgi:dipeptidyl-peptidase-4
MSEAVSFPRQSARTRRFTLGEPRSISIRRDGSRLLFLRAMSGTDPRTGLWCLDLPDGAERLVVDPTVEPEADLPAEERARRERVRETAAGVVAYSADREGGVAVYTTGGALHAVDVDTGEVRSLPTPGAVYDPHVDPTGTRAAYVCGGSVRVVDLASGDDRALVEATAPEVGWGRAEHVAAEEMNRPRGYWWSPDGDALLVTQVDERPVPTWWIADPAHPDRPPHAVRYPAAGSDNAVVTLHHVALDGTRTEIGWDREALPYLARVGWQRGFAPLLAVQSRDQRRVVTLSVDVEAGTTSVVAEDTDDVWVELFDGVPAWCGDRVVRIADDGGARRLYLGSDAVTGPEICVRSVVSVEDASVVFTASYDDPTQVHVVRWSPDGLDVLTSDQGVHAAVAGAGVVVTASAGLGHFGQRFGLLTDGVERTLTSVAEQPPLVPDVRLMTAGKRALRVGVVLPRDHVPGTKLPVLMDPYGGPHAQRVLSARRVWLEPQWLADQGFAVVVADGRGTPGRDPAWERAVHHDLAVTLDDQVDALHATAEAVPDLDLERVAIRGWSFGGYLAALAVLRRPDVFHAAVAGAPVIDWSLYDTHYTERYLGTPATHPDVYARNSLLDDAPALSRPLLLIHGLADDNVVAAHSLLLSQQLTAHGRAHSLLPLTGVTHMTPQEEVAENLLLVQVQFLRSALGVSPSR